MESSTIMGDPSPRRARITEKRDAVMTESALAHLLRLARSVRFLPQNPPPNAVALAVVTAAVLGAATGFVLALAAPAPESSDAPPAAVVAASFPSRAPKAVPPSLVAVRRPDVPATSPEPTVAEPAVEGPTVAEPAVEEALAMAAEASAPRAAAPSPPVAMRILTMPSPAPRATGARPLAARSPLPPGNAAANLVSRNGAAAGVAPSLAAPGPSALEPSPLDAPARSGEGTGDDGSAADELIRLTERAFQSGHPAEAVRLGKEALAAHGGARAHLALAAAYFDLRRFDDARASYEAVLQTEPGNQAARIGLDLAKTAQARSPEQQP